MNIPKSWPRKKFSVDLKKTVQNFTRKIISI